MQQMTPQQSIALNHKRIRAEFPALHQQVHGKPLVYLDNAATTQKPEAVIDTIDRYYREDNANIHRGIHALAERATEAYEGARTRVAQFLNARTDREIIFTRGTTEAINLVAQSWGRANLAPGDEVLISHMEHHSNIVPWQIACQQTGATLKVIPIDDHGQLDMDKLDELLTEKTKLLGIVQMSNALGTINPVATITRKAKAVGAKVLVDAAQSVPHLGVDVQQLDCDFLAFSGHKIYGPTGIGALYGRLELLEEMPPYQSGGDMIKSVAFDGTVYNDPPYRFEAGTPNIAGGIALATAIDYVDQTVGLANIAMWEHELLTYATEQLSQVKGLKLIGTAERKASVLSFTLDFAHPLDAGTILDRQGIAVRTGHHCAQPVMDRYGIPATIRASLAVYNTKADIDALVVGLEKVREFV
ncbi:SufS family cysteine desulfurase [Phycisphaerales bacterium AB-hyl4]|uniref:Cysteine desulfurase n=1 Tax=Natronomicrosphaera hydrolytica TaxID=3242702 RepID=A0ABV4UB37_9BACT